MVKFRLNFKMQNTKEPWTLLCDNTDWSPESVQSESSEGHELALRVVLHAFVMRDLAAPLVEVLCKGKDAAHGALLP